MSSNEPDTNRISINRIIAYVIVLMIGGGAVGGVSFFRPAPDVAVLQSQIDELKGRVALLAELEMRRMPFGY